MIETMYLSEFRPDLYKIVKATSSELLIEVCEKIVGSEGLRSIMFSDKNPLMVFIPKHYYTRRKQELISDKYDNEMKNGRLFIFDSGSFSWKYTCDNLPSKDP